MKVVNSENLFSEKILQSWISFALILAGALFINTPFFNEIITF